jgi:hypothetical protein
MMVINYALVLHELLAEACFGSAVYAPRRRENLVVAAGDTFPTLGLAASSCNMSKVSEHRTAASRPTS